MNDRQDYRPSHQLPESSVPRNEDEGSYRYFTIIVIVDPNTGQRVRVPVVYSSDDPMSYADIRSAALSDAAAGNWMGISKNYARHGQAARVVDVVIVTAERRT